jgi:hypothetical protein
MRGQEWNRLIECVREHAGTTRKQADALIRFIMEEDEPEVVENALDGDEDDMELFLLLAMRYMRGFHRLRAVTPSESGARPRVAEENEGQRSTSRDVSGYASPVERLRAAVLERHYAKVARALPAVIQFRKEALEGRLCTDREAWVVLRSPLAAHAPAGPIRALKLDVRDPGWCERASSDEAIVELENVRRCDQEPLVLERGARAGVLRWADPDGTIRSSEYFDPSLLQRLAQLADALSSQFPWKFPQAVWFVLTDQEPNIAPITVSLHEVADRRVGEAAQFRRIQVSIHAESWISPLTIERAYKAVQGELLHAAGRKRLKGVGAETLELVQFVDAGSRSMAVRTFVRLEDRGMLRCNKRAGMRIRRTSERHTSAP